MFLEIICAENWNKATYLVETNSLCKLWKLQSEPHDVDPRGRSREVEGCFAKASLQITPPTSPKFP
jgi:hypothetical protein